MKPPLELEHARRHLERAELELRADKPIQAAVHLREAIADTAWALYQAAVPELAHGITTRDDR